MGNELMAAVQDFVLALVTGLLAVLCTFVIALAKKGFDWLGAKIDSVKSEKARSELQVAREILETTSYNVVTSLQQTIGDEIKKSIKDGDGKYTREDLLSLKDKAVDAIETQLSEGVYRILSENYGDLDAYILDLVETQVRGLKVFEATGVQTVPATGILLEG